MASQPASDSEALKGLGTQFGGEISPGDDSPRRKVVLEWMKWLGTDPVLDDDSKQKKLLQTLEPGTGRWLLELREFREWMATPESSTLRCYGIPGAGKTVMTSLVIETLRNNFSMEDGVAIVFRYLSVGGRDSFALVLTEIIKQIILLDRENWHHGALEALLQKHRKGLERPSEEALLQVLTSIIAGQYRTIFIVLDGLDALDLAEKRKQLAAFDYIQQLAGPAVKLFLTSRDISKGALREERKTASLIIRASDDDITLYVNNHIRSDLPFVAKDSALQDNIRDTIMKVADGMFLIVYLAMQSLALQRTRDGVRLALDRLNEGRFQALDDIYDHLFGKINSVAGGPDRQMLQRVLSWLLLANRRLSRAELRDVLCWSDGDGDAPYHFRSSLFFAESWLVESGEDGILDLIHPTASDYLRRVHPTLCAPEVEVEMLNSCVRYLARSEFSEGPCSSSRELARRLKMFPFYSYAAKNWGHHALRPSVASLGVTEPTRFFLQCPAQVAAAGQALRDRFIVWRPTALHLSSYLGLVNIARLLLTDAAFDQSAEQGDEAGRTPLAWAARNGHINVMTLLLQHGAYIDAQDQTGSTALAFAIAHPDHECARNTVRFLIDLGADVNSQDEFGVTPLSQACRIRHIGVAELLLQRGADVNLRDRYNRSALWQAARMGHFAMVKLLLHRGADLMAEDNWGETPVVASIRSGAAIVVQQLLDAGAVITDREYHVEVALKLGHPDCADILRGLGTGDPDSESDRGTDFPSSTPTPVADPDSAIDDARTEYSEVGPFTEAQRERLVVGLAVDLADRVLPKGGRADDAIKAMDAAAAERMMGMLPKYLKDFALKIGYEPRDDDAKKIMYIVHKYKRQIVDAFEIECLRNGFQLPGQEYSPPTSLTEYSEDGPLESIDAREKVLLWRNKVIPNTAEENATENTALADRDAKDEAGGMADYLNLTTDTPAYHCLVGYLRRELSLTYSGGYVMAEVGTRIADSLPEREKVTWRKAATSHCMVFELDWDPQAFVWDQKIDEECGNAVAMAITITGSANDAQALSCSQYLAQTWPGAGPEVLELIKGAVRDGASCRTSLSHGARLEARIQGSKLVIEATGVRPALVELGEQLAWLGATLRSSPSVDGKPVFYCRPRIRQRKASIPPSPFVHWRFHFDLVEVPPEDVSAHELRDGHCWYGLFRRPVIVQGYPIRRKPRQRTGLEIGLSLAAELVQAPGAALFDGRVVLKGFCAILVLMEQVQNTLLWHLVLNENQEPMSYRDPQIERLRTQPLADGPSILPGLEKGRHVVGWCSKALGLAGEVQPNYNIKFSGLNIPSDRDRFPPLFLQQVSGENDTRLASRDIGDAYGDPLDGFYRNRIARMAETFFVFYDTEEQRGWLVEGAAALLHIVRASLQLDQDSLINQTFANQFIFKMTEYNENNTPRLGTRAASVLSYKMNTELPLFSGDGPSVSFRKRVEVICEMLVLALDTQGAINRKYGDEIENFLQGYDFRRIAMNNRNNGQVRAVMLNSAPERRLSWLHLTRRLNAPILFGRDFGDLIRPQDTQGLCKAWHALPKELGYLAVLGSDLNVILERGGGGRDRVPWRVAEDVCWFDPGCIFEVCPATQRRWYTFAKALKQPHHGCSHDHCEIAQVLVLDGSPVAAGFSSHTNKPVQDKLDTNCAVVFGFLEQYHYRHGEGLASSNPDIRISLSRASGTSREPGRSRSGFGGASELLRSAQSYTPSNMGEDASPNMNASGLGAPMLRPPSTASPAASRPTMGLFYVTIGILATVAAAYWDYSFYVRTACLSVIAMLLWGKFVFEISPGSSWMAWLGRRILFFLLLAWCLVLSPLHLLWTPLELWIKDEVHPPFNPYQIIFAPQGAIDIDVFAIHGLGSNPNSAWRYRGSGEGRTVDWLTEILPRQEGCQEIRITLLNHQTRWDSRTPQVDFTTHAKSMLSHVERINQGKRPIIFLAHSFGGLLLKQLLIDASTESREIAKMTRGILFLGVPHHGSKYSLLARLMACTAFWRGSSTALLQFVDQGNKELKTLDDRFARIYAGRSGHNSPVGAEPYIANLIEMVPEGFGKLSLSPTVTLEGGELTYGKQAILGTDHRGLNKYPSAEDPCFREFFVHFNASCHHAWER